MTNCIAKKIQFPPFKGLSVEAQFVEEEVTGDGGVLLLREIDRKLRLTERLSKIIPDKRDPLKIQHTMKSMLQQRIYGLALGYEDLNDHNQIRHDAALQTAIDKIEALASSSTLCRLEHTANRKIAFEMSKILVEIFIESFKQPPKELILDMDATEDEVHGHQEGRYYHGYYQSYCFLPLHIFCGEQLLVSYLRPSFMDGAKHAWAIIALLVKRFREVWPFVKIIVRADSGFCRDSMLRWFEKKNISYIIGIPGNNRLEQACLELQNEAEHHFKQFKESVCLFGEFKYSAESWDKERRVIVKVEHTGEGLNTRYTLTNIKQRDAERLYKDVYCKRANMENRIKELKNDLYSDRTSCHRWWPNQFRLLLSSMAYVLMEGMRRLALKNTELAKAQCSSIRLKLYKIGAVIFRNTRRVCFLLSHSFPRPELFSNTAENLCYG